MHCCPSIPLLLVKNYDRSTVLWNEMHSGCADSCEIAWLSKLTPRFSPDNCTSWPLGPSLDDVNLLQRVHEVTDFLQFAMGWNCGRTVFRASPIFNFFRPKNANGFRKHVRPYCLTACRNNSQWFFDSQFVVENTCINQVDSWTKAWSNRYHIPSLRF